MFARWGRFVYRFRWATLIASVLLLGLSIVAILTGGALAGNGGFGADLPAGKTAQLINQQIHPQTTQAVSSGSSFTLIFSSTTLSATDPTFQSAIEAAVAPLSSDARVTTVRTPYDVPAGEQTALISRDAHEVKVELKDPPKTAQGYVSELAAKVQPGPLRVVLT